jgi:serine/threonine protein kinase
MIAEGASFGQYHELRRLGGGGAGEVYLAEQPSVDGRGAPARVALKLLDGRADDPAARQLTREVRAAADLGNVHIIPYYGVAVERGVLAVVMAYAPGGSLGDNLRAGDRIPLPLPPGVVARIISQLARALAAVHGAGLVHGDLKPNNIFVRTAPNGAPLAVVADFGQAILMQAAATLAMSGSVTGEQVGWIAEQLRFAAPEQLSGPAVAASDQYGLAAVAYYLLTGRPPFAGDALTLLAAIPQQPVTPPSQYIPELPREAERALLRALAKRPEERFASITQFGALLADTLAVPVGAAPGASGVTEQFSALAASRSDVYHPGSSGSGRPRDLSLFDGAFDAADAELPDDASPQMRRLLSVGIGGAVLALLITCVVTASVLWSGGNPLQLPTALGQTIAGNATPTPPQIDDSSPEAQAAEQQLASVTGRSPVFADAFGSNNAHWATSDAVSIQNGHLSLTNKGGQTPALETTPSSLQLSAVAARVDVAVASGSSSDLQGLCFWVSADAKGRASYYCSLISSDGRYELWQYHAGGAPAWLYVAGGYSAALKLGVGQVNTLAVLASAKQGYATLFANGHYITRIHLTTGASVAGNVGLLVLDVGTRATFTNYAVYDAS